MQIHITLKNYRCFSDATPLTFVLSDGVTALVGPNNAGKSTLLKFFYEFRPIFLMLTDMNVIRQLDGGGELGFQPPQEIADLNELFFNGNDRNMEVHARIETEGIPNRGTVVTEARIALTRGAQSFRGAFLKHGNNIRAGGDANLSWTGTKLVALNAQNVIADFSHLIAAFRVLSATCYISSFRHVSHFAPTDSAPREHYDMRVGKPFIDQWRDMQTGNSLANRQRIHKLVAEIKAIFGFRELQINASGNGNALQLMIEGNPYNLQNLGAGIAQFVLVLGTAALREQSFILIDEPELSLHPSLQVVLVMKLAEYASAGLVLATHNVGLARSVADTILSVTRGPEGASVIAIDKTPRLAELLGELNYEGYRPLGFDKVLLVEGRTSYKVFIELLRILNRDHEFLVVTMSDLITANSREELQEVTRICPEVFAVIDSERTQQGEELEPGRHAFVQNCADLGIDCHVLERRAIENYLPDRAVKEELGQAYRGLGAYEGRHGVQLWPKKDNWRVARRMQRGELEATDLGQFLTNT